jgi:D-glycero-D-manno-heptose 1,7-bisphosphate phosphatase
MLIWTASPQRQPRSFLFLDRDGVINRDRPDYVKRWEEMEIFPDALEGLKWLQERSVGVVLISNQSGLNRGIISWEDFWAMHEKMVAAVRNAGGDLMAAFFCPHRPDEGCSCRKPAPGMIRAASRLFRIPEDRCFMVGDRWTDVEAGARAGCRAALVEREGAHVPSTGGFRPDWPVPTHPTLLDAVMALPWPEIGTTERR